MNHLRDIGVELYQFPVRGCAAGFECGALGLNVKSCFLQLLEPSMHSERIRSDVTRLPPPAKHYFERLCSKPV